MEDKELDKLIMATLEREQTLESLNHTIVRDVRRRARREWLRRWGRVVVFSFGLPLILVVCALGMWKMLSIPSVWPARFCLLIPLATMLYLAQRGMKDFSLTEV